MDPLEIVARLGGDNPPSLDELNSARAELVDMLRHAAAQPAPDLEAMQSLRAAIDAATSEVAALEAAAAELAAETAELLDGLDDGEEVSEETEEEPVAASVLPLSQAMSRLRPSAEPEPQGVSHTVVTSRGEVDGSEFTLSDLSAEFSRRYQQMPSGKDVLASVRTTPAEGWDLRKIGSDHAAVTRLVDAVVSPQAVTAAGGCCSICEPVFDQPVLSSTARPIRAALPTFTSSRGRVCFFPAVCLPQDGTFVWTCDDDAAVDPDDPTTWKPCVNIECPEEASENVEAVGHCVNIGNWQRRFAAERWQAILNALMAQQARVAEANLFDLMVARATTTHTCANDGGFLSTFFDCVARAAAQIRQDQRYDGMQLRLVAAQWVRDALRDDAFRWGAGDGIKGLTDATIAAWLAQYGVTAVWSPDVDPILPESPGQVDGPLEDYPAEANAVLFAEGAHVFLDGGEFDLGTEITDVANARQNQVTAFAESFEGLMTRTCNSKHLLMEVVTSGACCAAAA